MKLATSHDRKIAEQEVAPSSGVQGSRQLALERHSCSFFSHSVTASPTIPHLQMNRENSSKITPNISMCLAWTQPVIQKRITSEKVCREQPTGMCLALFK